MHRPTIQRLAAAFGFAVAILASNGLAAATFCVSTVQQLQAAIDTAESNNEADFIRIHIGQYDVPNGIAYSGGATESDGLHISGGWLSFPSACATQFPDASLTVLDGLDVGRGLSMSSSVSNQGNLSAGNLSIVRSYASSSSFNAGLSIGVPANSLSTTAIDVYNLRVQGCKRRSVGHCGIVIFGPTDIKLRNVLVADADAGGNNASVGIKVSMNSLGSVQAQHITLANNHTYNFSYSGLVLFDNIPLTVENSILYGNRNTDGLSTYDCDLLASPNTTVRNSIADRVCGNPIPGQVDIMDVDPGFVGADYRFGPDSPALDGGLAVTTIPAIPKDLAGNDRIQGSLPDLGAYEGAVLPDLMLVDGFE